MAQRWPKFWNRIVLEINEHQFKWLLSLSLHFVFHYFHSVIITQYACAYNKIVYYFDGHYI